LKGFYAQKDLERLRFQNARIDPERLIEVNTRIVDRPRASRTSSGFLSTSIKVTGRR